MRMFFFRLSIKINNFVSFFFPVDDIRKKDVKKKYPTVQLVPETFYAEKAVLYHYPEAHKPVWVEIFENGFTVPEICYIEFNNAYIIGKGLLLNEHKKVFLESAFFQREYLRKLLVAPQLVKTLFVSPNKQIDYIIPLSNRLSNNYFHWTAENLTRIALLIDQRKNLSDNYSIAINDDAPGFTLDSLYNLIGWPKEKIVKLPVKGIASTSSCIMISYAVTRNESTSMFYAYPPTIFRRLNQLAFENISRLEHLTPSAFIISRNRTQTRRLVNENEVLNFFEEISLSILHLEELSFVQQVRAFQDAKFILAPHGAGLTNLVYCNPSTVVVELFPVNRDINQTSSFHQISKAICLRYHVFMPDPINKAEDMVADDAILNEVKNILVGYGLMQKQ